MFLAKCQEVNTLITHYVNDYVPIRGYNTTIQGWINSGLTGEHIKFHSILMTSLHGHFS